MALVRAVLVASMAQSVRTSVAVCIAVVFIFRQFADVHLDLEKQIAKFMNADESILYASGFNTIASAIPAFLKLGDLVLCDEQCYISIQQGCQLSRADTKVDCCCVSRAEVCGGADPFLFFSHCSTSGTTTWRTSRSF